MNDIIGIGTDIIEIYRIKESIDRQGQPFLDRLFVSSEQDYCRQCKDPLPRFAARFAAKEAIAKALKTGIGKTIGWKDLIIKHTQEGAVKVELSNKAKQAIGDVDIQLSISHSSDFALAFAIVTKKKIAEHS